MDDFTSIKVSVTISRAQLKQIDNLARHYSTSRSGVLRRAIAEYVIDPERKYVAAPNKKLVETAYEYIKTDYPLVNRDDDALILMLSQQKAEKEKKKAGYNTYEEET